MGAVGCRTASTGQTFTHEELLVARSELTRPISGNLAALYRLRIPSSGGLRLSVLTLADNGRVTISEPFGSAVSLTVWSGAAPPVVFDLRKGCRFITSDVSGVLGVGSLPLPQAVRLLGGRLPATEADLVELRQDGRLRVSSETWQGLVTVTDDPWRVTAVEDLSSEQERSWRVQLRDHTGSVPGWLRVRGADGRWAELELVRLEWDTTEELPTILDLPWCRDSSPRNGGTDNVTRDGPP
jgi:hypothetical protein